MRHSGGGHVAHADRVVAVEQVLEARGRVGDRGVVGHEGDGAVVAHDPVAVVVLGPIGDLVPVARLVLERELLLLGRGAPRLAHVADVFGAVGALLAEHGELLGRGHVLVGVGDTVLGLDILPGLDPVGPGVGHTNGLDLALLLRLRDEVFERHLVVINSSRIAGAIVATGQGAARHDSHAGARQHVEELAAGHAALHRHAHDLFCIHVYSHRLHCFYGYIAINSRTTISKGGTEDTPCAERLSQG